MPTYDYLCDACGHQFEAFQSMKDDALKVCPQCAESALRRIISGGAGVIFKGSGFYVNDSKRRASTADTANANGTSDAKAGAGGTSDAAKSESGSDKGSTSGSNEKKTA